MTTPNSATDTEDESRPRFSVSSHRGLGLLRQLRLLARHPLGRITELNGGSDVQLFEAFGKQFVLLTEPALINDLLVDRRQDFEKGVFYDRVRRLAGNGVVLANGGEHRRQREYLDQFFKRGHVLGLREPMLEVVRAELATWPTSLDADAALHRMTFKILAATMFGTDVESEQFDGIHEWLELVLEAIMFRTFVPSWYLRIPTRRNRLHDNAMDQLRTAITSTMQSGGDNADEGRPDLLSVMRAVRKADGSSLSADEMTDQIVAITMAGAETAATALSWFVVELAADQELQSSLRSEVVAAHDRGVEYGPDLSETPLLRSSLSELLRCRQPILAISRRAIRSTTLQGYQIKAGSEVLYSPWAMHRDKAWFAAGAAFDTETFGERGCPVAKGAYTPFGLGTRHCVGEQYAWQMMFIVVGELLTTVRIDQATAQHPEGRPLATIIPGRVGAHVTATGTPQ